MWSDPHNSALLGRLQRGVPLRLRPFDVIAEEVGQTVPDVLDRLRTWQESGIIGETSALFDSQAMGYRNALIAQQVSSAQLEAASKSASDHPGVSHCYIRGGRYNLWFTLAVSPMSKLGLAATVDRLARRAGDAPTLVLSALRRYKLRVQLPAASPAVPTDDTPPVTPNPQIPSPEQQDYVRRLQQPLPLCPEPFEEVARSAGMRAESLLAIAQHFRHRGWLRRIAPMIRHIRAGARVNVLVAWRVADDRIDEVGLQAAREKAVSHCYRRKTAPDWPYALYTMIHGRRQSEVGEVIQTIESLPGVIDRTELPTLREVKKQRTKLFTDDEASWEQQGESA